MEELKRIEQAKKRFENSPQHREDNLINQLMQGHKITLGAY